MVLFLKIYILGLICMLIWNATELEEVNQPFLCIWVICMVYIKRWKHKWMERQQDVPKYKSKETCIKVGSHKQQLYLLYIYFENLIYRYKGFYQYFMYIWLLTCTLFALDTIHFLNSSEVTWSKWTSLCSKISGSEEFNYSITTRHWGQGEMFGDKTVLKTGRKCLLKHAVLYK